jgi:hypothetical protein
MYIQLRRRLVANNTGVGAPFSATVDYFDTTTRRPLTILEDSDTNNPAELARGVEVYRYEVRAGLIRVVHYDGNGSVYTSNVRSGAGGGASPNLEVVLNLNFGYVSGPDKADACVDVTGGQGLPPYQVSIAPVSGGAVIASGVSPSQYFPYRLRNLPGGDLLISVTDATGTTATRPFRINTPAVQGQGAGIALRDDYDGDSQTGSGTQWFWILNDLDIEQTTYTGGGSGDINGDHYQRPGGELVDAYLLPDGVTWRRVLSDGAPNGDPGVYFEDGPAAAPAGSSLLALDNLIIFHPDLVAEQNGGVLVEVSGTRPPFTFTLGAASNQHGSFDGLGAGPGRVVVSDAAGNTLTVPFELKVRFGKRWVLNFSDIDGVPLRLELWPADYTGLEEPLKGQAQVVRFTTDGLNTSLGGQGDLPPTIGTSADIQLRVHPGQLEAIVTGTDRACRVDFYYNNVLDFRGYVQPAVYEEELQDGLVPVSLLATDGLASLSTTYFTGHIGQRLVGHRPWLNTILHCLSRTDVALPVGIYTNRRDEAMSDEDAPELAATSNRTGYWEESKNEPIFCRDVLSALAQALGGTLCQRGARWEVRSPLEAAKTAQGRTYRPAGTPLAAVIVTPPLAAITPPRPNGVPASLFWIGRSQRKLVRAGWKSLVGQTDVGYLKNALPLGKVFSDPYAWSEDRATLRAITQWLPGPSGFPLVLSRLGQKGGDYATQWPRSAATSAADTRYLQSPALPLVAGAEAIPAYLSITAKLVASDTYLNAQGGQSASPTTATKALLPYEVLIDGFSQGVQVLEVVGDTTVTVPLLALLNGAAGAVVRFGAWYAPDTNVLANAPGFDSGKGYQPGDVIKYPRASGGPGLWVALLPQKENGFGANYPPTSVYKGYWAEVTPTNQATGTLLVSEVGVQLRPQGGTWEGEDNFRADGPGGTVRPTEPLKAFHADVPITAGLYAGNLYAFGKAVALADGTMSTSWARAIDLLPSPLFESNVYDALALRSGNSKLLLGTLRHRGAPPRLLDALDTPSDLPGRRFLVAARAWEAKRCRLEVSLLEIGAGEDAQPQVAAGARIIHELTQLPGGQYVPVMRGTHDGSIRVRG